jgi:hypothetical protein
MTDAAQPRFILACRALVLVAVAALSGCNILGPAGYFILGPDKQQAVYKLDPTKATVIVIDDKANIVPQRSLREVIGRTAEEDLLAKGTVKDMVKSAQALGVLSRERFGSPMTIQELGQSLKADVVIFTAIDEFSLSQDGQSVTPLSKLRMKVVDVATGQRVFPEPNAPEWYPLAIRLPAQSMEKPTGAAIMQGNQSLARITGIALAQLFYEHVPNSPDKLKDASK